MIRFRASQEVSVPSTFFARTVSRALRALLAHDHRTREIQVVFVCCEDAEVDMAFNHMANTLYLHEKWLDFQRVHVDSECPVWLSSEPSSDGFFCDHVVEELYKRAVVMIFKEVEQLWLSQSDHVRSVRSLFQRSRTKLRQMPRMIRTVPVEQGVGILVSWLDGESKAVSEVYGSQFMYQVVLHSSGCSDRLGQLLYLEGLPCLVRPFKVEPR